MSNITPVTNKHLRDIFDWVNQQSEPEVFWMELKCHLRRLEDDFRVFLKKRHRGQGTVLRMRDFKREY